jgi:hypothetical protein
MSSQARLGHRNHGEFCHIVQHVVLLHAMWRDGTAFRFGKEPAAKAGLAAA